MTTQQAVAFRPLRADDLPMLHEWIGRPHVQEWWDGAMTLADVEEEFLPAIAGREPVQCYLALAGGEPIGFIQSYIPAECHPDGWWLEENDPAVRGIDQFLAHEHQLGQGLGTAMVRAFVEHLLADPAVSRIQTDPAPANRRAIRCYEKAGFRPMREIDTPDGRALLMYLDRPPA